MAPQNRSSSLKFSSRTRAALPPSPSGRGCEIAWPDRRPFCLHPGFDSDRGRRGPRQGRLRPREIVRWFDVSRSRHAVAAAPAFFTECRDLAVIQPPFIPTGDCYGCLETEKGHGMSEGMSRRKALSLLGLGAALGFTLSAALKPSAAEAQEAATPPAAPAEATGTHGMNRRQSRRTGRHERRHGRHERRHTRRTGEKPAAAAPAEGAPAGTAPAPQ